MKGNHMKRTARLGYRAALLVAAMAASVAACSSGTTSAPASGSAVNATVSASASVPPGTVLRVGDQQDFLKLPLQVSGQDQNFPYTVQYSTFLGPQIIEGFTAGKLDLGMTSDGTVLNAQAAGVPIVIVAVARGSGEDTAIVVRPGMTSTIKTLSDLKGKSIAFSTNNAFALEALASVGLKVSDVHEVNIQTADVVAALESNDVDAAVVPDPELSAYLADTPGSKVLTYNTLTNGTDDARFIITTKSTLEDPGKVAAIADYIRRLSKSRIWVNSHLAQWTQTYYVQDQKIAPAIAPGIVQRSGVYTYTPLNNDIITRFEDVADVLRTAGVYPASLNPKSVFDLAFNADVQQS
jgi:sulfonate transport system substrate-binding protein